MFRFLCKNLVLKRSRDLIINNNDKISFYFIQIQSLKTKSKWKSSDQNSLTVSYLIESCGLSLESSIKASKKMFFKTTERPDSVLELLKKHGFTKTHITKLFTKDPLMLLANPDILKPKLEYFESLGISGSHLAKILSSDRGVLRSSLTERIIPNFDFIRTLVYTNQSLVATFKQCSRIATCSLTIMESNISTLKSHGVPESVLVKLIMAQPITLMQNPSRFNWAVNQVKEMGFVPSSRIFSFAVHTMLGLSKLNWEKKIEVFKSVGWSEKEALSAFRLQPNFMLTSEEKVRKMMDFFVNNLGLKPSKVAQYPNLLLYSLEKRIIPRSSVLQVLKSKGLIRKDLGVITAFHISSKTFAERYVTRFQVDVPELIEVFECKKAQPELKTGVEDANQTEESKSSSLRMGFVPTSRICSSDVHTMLGLSKLDWEKKIEVFKSVGWSEKEVLRAVRLQPTYKIISEKKVRKMMDFFVNNLGLKPLKVAQYPILLLYSLEKRIIPRSSVLQVLKSEGLIRKDLGVITAFNISSKTFAEKYVTRFQNDVPELIELFECKKAQPKLETGVEDANQTEESKSSSLRTSNGDRS